MKTMEKLCDKFDRKYPAYVAILDSWCCKGYYPVWIKDLISGLQVKYIFTTCREFKDWMDKVVLY